MNAVDIAIIVILAAATFAGFRQGFILEMATILGVVIALTVARAEYSDIRQMLEQFASRSPWLTVIAYLLVFLAVWAAVIIVARRLRAMAHVMMLGGLDRLGGAIIGFLQGALILNVLVYLARRAPSSGLRKLIHDSTLAGIFQQSLPLLHRLFPHIPAV